MRIAVISDIHSNLYALEAGLSDIERKNIDLILCAGDLVGYHTRPNEIIEIIKKSEIICVKGNHDKIISENSIVDISNLEGKEFNKFSIRNYGIETTINENKQFLKNLLEETTLEIENIKIKLVHGSPNSITEYLKENSKEAELVMKELKEDILICGHTHQAYFKSYGEKLLINAGSVGKPKKGTPNPEYVILEIKEGIINVSIENFIYDYEKMAKEIENSKLPKNLAIALRKGEE